MKENAYLLNLLKYLLSLYIFYLTVVTHPEFIPREARIKKKNLNKKQINYLGWRRIYSPLPSSLLVHGRDKALEISDLLQFFNEQ